MASDPARASKHSPTALLLLALALGCNKQTSIAVVVFGPDGGDPFLPPDGATEARLTVDDQATPPRSVPVAANGAFSLDVDVGNPAVASRITVEALSNGTVVGGGSTPPVQWGAIGPAIVPVFVQRSNSLVLAPWGDAQVARTRPYLLELQNNFVASMGGATDTSVIDVYDIFGLRSVTGAINLDGMFNRDGSALRLADGTVLVLRGCMSIVWNPSTNAVTRPDAQPPMGRCDLLGSTVVQEPGGGGLILGGRGPMGAVARVDQVLPTGNFNAVPDMTVARERPSAARLGPFQVLIAGGQTGAEEASLEQYSAEMTGPRRAISTHNRAVDTMSRTTLVAVGDEIVLALGGTVAGSTDLTPFDAVLDTRCLGGACDVLVSPPAPLLSERRRDAEAARAGTRVVVASGTTVGGPARTLEVIDVRVPRAPVALGSVAELGLDGLSLMALSTGSVLIVGGGQTHVWLYR